MDPDETTPAGTPQDWAERRRRLDARLAAHAAERERERTVPANRGGMQGMAEGLKLASEFAAGVIVGGAIGYGVDQLAGSTPFGLIVFLMLGFAAGVRNVLRHVSPQKPPSDPDGERTEERN